MIDRKQCAWTLALTAGLLFTSPAIGLVPYFADAEVGKPRVRVEVFLARDHKPEARVIEERFGEIGVDNVHFQFFRAGNPPRNVAIGKDVPIEAARLAIELALEFNRGVGLIVPQALLPPTWVGIGTSAFDEQNQIPISGESLARLRDTALTQHAFHELYRDLANHPKIY